MFNTVRTGNYSQSAKAVNRANDQIFDAGMSAKPDFTKIAKESIKARSMERRAVTQAEADVASAGLKAFTDVTRTKNKIESEKKINDIMRPAKRMAGIVGGLGAIAGGYVMMEGDKQDKADREELRGMRDAMNAKQVQRDAAQEAQFQAQLDLVKSQRGGTSDPKTDVPAPSNAGTTKPSPAVAPKTTGTGLQAKSKKSPGFKGFVDMAANAGAKYPQLVAAQWALESGWGKTPSGQNNFFGIKAGSGEQGTSKQTWEVEGGKEITTSARFKDFASPQDSVNELVSRWHQDYKGYSGVNNASDAFAAADMLTTEGYATDPNYANKLKKIMRDQGY